MKSKLGFLVVASLLLSAGAFAHEKKPNVLTIQVAGNTIATISLAGQPKDAKLSLSADSKDTTIVYDTEKGVVTMKGKFTFEITQNDKSVMKLAVEDGVATYNIEEAKPLTSPPAVLSPATIFSLPQDKEHPGGFCGQAEVNRMVLNTEAGKEMQRQQQAAIRRSQASVAARTQIPVQPQPTTTTTQK